jgi:dTDP-4-dehydrorhamnose 3,5-epimerase
MHHDSRGIFTEVFRETWNTGVHPVQWNIVTSNAGVLRGVHVHIRHNDYLILLKGHASIGLRDLRKNSPTYGMTSLIEMKEDQLQTLTIPYGVAHGFYFHKSSLHLYAVSEYFNPEDELRCHWADPELKIPWPTQSAHVSDCDAGALSFNELIHQLELYQSI